MPPKVLAHASTDNLDFGDDDEFADAFGDDVVDDEMEASLAKLEESFQSQRNQQTSKNRSSSSIRNDDGTVKRNNGNVSMHTIGSKGDSIYYDDKQDDYFHNFKGRYINYKMGNEDPMGSSQEVQYGMSVRASSKVNKQDPESDRSHRSAARASKRARLQYADDNVSSDLMTTRREESSIVDDEIAADRKRIEVLERQLVEKENEILRYKKENQIRLGEASVLRANMNKTVADFSSVLREKEVAIAKQKALNTEMKKMHEEQMARSETINAFKHTELATTAHWSSISASAARRRGMGGGMSSQRGYSQSQTAAAAAGLTTPTKRNKAAPRNLGSGEGTSDRSGGASRTGDRAAREESPSSRRSVLRQRQQQNLTSAAKMKPKAPAFPGFVNSFSKKPVQMQSAKKADPKKSVEPAVTIVPDDEDTIFQDDQSSPLVERADQAIGPGSSLMAPPVTAEKMLHGWSNPEHRHLWAITTYTKRLSYLSSLVLSHTSAPCSTAPASLHTSTSPTTLYRLLNAALPPDTPISQQEQYILATHTLLNALSQESAKDAENRFSYLLEPFGYEEETTLDEASRRKEEDAVFWACYSYMDEGIDEVLSDLSSALCLMLAICIDIGAAERVYDVLIMMRTICIHHPSMLHAVLTTNQTRMVEGEQHSSESQSQEEELLDTQRNGEVANAPKEIDISKLMINCVKCHCRLESDDKGITQSRWKIDIDAAEKILQAVMDVVALMAYEEPQSNICVHKLRRIIDSQGFISSLLDYSRRSSVTIRKTLQVCTRLAQQSSLWRNIIACKVDKIVEQPHRRGAPQNFKTDIPLLEILARLLVDGRASMDSNDIHSLHCNVITLLSQLVIHQQEALIIISESNSILAAVIKCMQIDTGFIWNDEGEEIQSYKGIKYMDLVERICIDVRFLCQLYIIPLRPVNLTKKLQSHECHLVLNGMKHYFTLAMSRIAFAPEPEYFDDMAASMLGSVNENVLDLLELILSPEEMDSAWEMLNDEEEGVQGEGDEVHPDRGSALESKGKAAETDTQTQMNEDIIDLT